MKKIVKKNNQLSCLIYSPANIIPDKRYPLIMFLHGVGECGNNLLLVEQFCLPKYLNEGLNLPCFVYAPQCPAETRWESIVKELITDLNNVIKEYPIDESNVVPTGFSMGAQGVWQLAVTYPSRFSKLVPVAGRIPSDNSFFEKIQVLKNKPVMIFHGTKDMYVDITIAEQIVSAFRNCEATQVDFVRYENSDHHETADKTYSNPELYRWILEM